MIATNLLLLVQGVKTIPLKHLPLFEAQLSERDAAFGSMRDFELESVVALVDMLEQAGVVRGPAYDGFVYSFAIPQISKEFDLLKICDNAVLDVELKSQAVARSQIYKQLEQNRHYLSPLGHPIYTFCFVSDARTLYELQENGDFSEVSAERLAQVIGQMGAPYEGRIEDLFQPKDYLLSPINDTERFLGGDYFLTGQQDQIKREFLAANRTQTAQAATCPVFLVSGSAGTGKSLLLYDLAMSWQGRGRACIIHCGNLSEGHERLNRLQDRFCIVAAKEADQLDLREYGVLLIDEAQRMWPKQLRDVARAAGSAHVALFVVYDGEQVLSEEEQRNNVEREIRALFPDYTAVRLTGKIRTNRDLAEFLRMLFGAKGRAKRLNTKRVKVACARDEATAVALAQAFEQVGYRYIPLAKEQGAAGTAEAGDVHSVIGQEFDRVVMAVGPEFWVDARGKLRAGSAQSSRDSMAVRKLYQGLSRARSNIALVLYANEPLYEWLIGLLEMEE